MLKEAKTKTMPKQLKETMKTMSNQIETINETKIIKSNQIKILKLKSTITNKKFTREIQHQV